jgi:hypothetical protein
MIMDDIQSNWHTHETLGQEQVQHVNVKENKLNVAWNVRKH